MGKEKENYFDKAVDKLEVQLEGKNLRHEWSTNRENLKKEHTLSTQELHRAFSVIGARQTLKDVNPITEEERPAPKNKAGWQKLYREVLGEDPGDLIIKDLKAAIQAAEEK